MVRKWAEKICVCEINVVKFGIKLNKYRRMNMRLMSIKLMLVVA